jgi:hypothetical protein
MPRLRASPQGEGRLPLIPVIDAGNAIVAGIGVASRAETRPRLMAVTIRKSLVLVYLLGRLR